jgi:hypothetical protein
MIQAFSTAIPIMLGAWWLVILAGALWRRTVWREAGELILSAQVVRGGTLRATWCGYALSTEAEEVRWWGGLRGPMTQRQAGSHRVRRAGWLDPRALA